MPYFLHPGSRRNAVQGMPCASRLADSAYLRSTMEPDKCPPAKREARLQHTLHRYRVGVPMTVRLDEMRLAPSRERWPHAVRRTKRDSQLRISSTLALASRQYSYGIHCHLARVVDCAYDKQLELRIAGAYTQC